MRDKSDSAPLIRALFFDLDGTLINAQGKISNEILAELKRVRKFGVKVAVATGRPLFAAEGIMKSLEIDAPSMFFAGALVMNPSSREVFCEVSLPKEETRRLVSEALSLNLSVELYARQRYFVEKITDLIEIHAGKLLTVYPEERPLLGVIEKEALLKIVISVRTGSSAEKELRALRERHPSFKFYEATASGDSQVIYANFISEKAGRERAFSTMTAALGVKAQAVASFGDALADETFLKLSGMGVAMGDAPQALKEAADCVTDTVEEEGVPKMLRKLFP